MSYNKFEKLKREIPHLMMPDKIRNIEKKLNIDGLSDKVLSEEWIEHQRNGWKYVKVVKPDDFEDLPDDFNHDILPLDNQWGDVVLFEKVNNT